MSTHTHMLHRYLHSDASFSNTSEVIGSTFQIKVRSLNKLLSMTELSFHYELQSLILNFTHKMAQFFKKLFD